MTSIVHFAICSGGSDKGRRALFEDGSPKSLTTWIPLSNATALNGCMYIVPALHDPTF